MLESKSIVDADILGPIRIVSFKFKLVVVVLHKPVQAQVTASASSPHRARPKLKISWQIPLKLAWS